MVVLNKIYTRTGDDGKTALGNGERVAKYSGRVAAYGTVDELNSFVGVARTEAVGEVDAALSRIQNDLFDLGADFCRPDMEKDAEADYPPLRIVPSQIDRLEAEIDAMNEALRDWVTNVENTYYLIGTAAGPHPYPEMVRDFQSVIGKELRDQMLEAEGRLPDALVAAVGGGSNAIGLFHPFLDDNDVKIYGVEAGGHGLEGEEHCASLTAGKPGVLHGNRTYLLQDEDGQILEGHSISAGLDYPGIGPEHSWLKEIGRVEYVPVMDDEALEAFQMLTRVEGIIPALEPSHALAHVAKLAPTMDKDQIIVMNLCGRGDKDVFAVGQMLGFDM